VLKRKRRIAQHVVSPVAIALISIILITIALYVPSLNSYFVQDDFPLLSAGKKIASNPLSLFFPSGNYPRPPRLPGGEDFPVGWRPLMYAWWALGWLVWSGTPVGFHVAQIVILYLILLCMFIISKQLQFSTRGGIFSIWFFLLMPLPVESFYWLGASPIHLVFALMSVIFFILWLKRQDGWLFLAIAFLAAILACMAKEAGFSSFFWMILAAIFVPGKRGQRDRILASGASILITILCAMIYFAMPVIYSSPPNGLAAVVTSYLRLLLLGWLQPAMAMSRAVKGIGLSAELASVIARTSSVGLLVAGFLAIRSLARSTMFRDRIRELAFILGSTFVAASPYALSGVTGGRYFIDISVWVACFWGRITDHSNISTRVVWIIIIICMCLSPVDILATRSVRMEFDRIGLASFMLCNKIRKESDHVNRYILVGFPRRGGYLRVWHLPAIIHLNDPSVREVKVSESVPRMIPKDTAVIVYSESLMPDRFYKWISSNENEGRDSASRGTF
jgi:hypothetical protein